MLLKMVRTQRRVATPNTTWWGEIIQVLIKIVYARVFWGYEGQPERMQPRKRSLVFLSLHWEECTSFLRSRWKPKLFVIKDNEKLSQTSLHNGSQITPLLIKCSMTSDNWLQRWITDVHPWLQAQFWRLSRLKTHVGCLTLQAGRHHMRLRKASSSSAFYYTAHSIPSRARRRILRCTDIASTLSNTNQGAG